MDKTLNVGGINGLGEGLINTNAKDFKELKSMIKKLSSNHQFEFLANSCQKVTGIDS